jgi:hypothetical protein
LRRARPRSSKRISASCLAEPRSKHGQEWPLIGGREPKNAPLIWYFVEPMTGIEPAYSAWEADVLPLNYIGLFDHEG